MPLLSCLRWRQQCRVDIGTPKKYHAPTWHRRPWQRQEAKLEDGAGFEFGGSSATSRTRQGLRGARCLQGRLRDRHSQARTEPLLAPRIVPLALQLKAQLLAPRIVPLALQLTRRSNSEVSKRQQVRNLCFLPHHVHHHHHHNHPPRRIFIITNLITTMITRRAALASSSSPSSPAAPHLHHHQSHHYHDHPPGRTCIIIIIIIKIEINWPGTSLNLRATQGAWP